MSYIITHNHHILRFSQDLLQRIIETMSFSDKVANFLEAPTDELDLINMDDVELIAGDVLERVRSQPNSPLASREASPIRFRSSISSTSTPSPTPSDKLEDSDRSDEEYIDTVENPESKGYIPNNISNQESLPNGHIQHTQSQHISRSRTKSQTSVDVSQEISRLFKI
ncbi:hypothetical protein NQ317_014649 [Molorchus minor]|uniref:Uncharacterized protein n=1 Tax=Molorchus minor TaxID=1323400 RepID=A0ABQ9JRF9_9CUCU|nr:hypothetical protein NQ317_014649 [Molorchus minor]